MLRALSTLLVQKEEADCLFLFCADESFFFLIYKLTDFLYNAHNFSSAGTPTSVDGSSSISGENRKE